MDLFSPVTALKGVGAVRAKQLAKLHIETLYDLIAFFPRDYEDRTKLLSIAGLTPGNPACFEAMVISQPQLSRIRKGMELVKVRVADETGRVDLVFFNQPYVKDQLNYGESYRFYGALREGYGHQMQNPAFEPVDVAGVVTGRILPIYPLTAGITNKLISACVRQALDASPDSGRNARDEIHRAETSAANRDTGIQSVRSQTDELYFAIASPDDAGVGETRLRDSPAERRTRGLGAR